MQQQLFDLGRRSYFKKKIGAALIHNIYALAIDAEF